jgi:hypothetical protein
LQNPRFHNGGDERMVEMKVNREERAQKVSEVVPVVEKRA